MFTISWTVKVCVNSGVFVFFVARTLSVLVSWDQKLIPGIGCYFKRFPWDFPLALTTYGAKSGSVKFRLWRREDERSLLWSPNNADQLITQDSMLWASRRSLNLIAHKTLSLIWAQETFFRPLAVDTNVWTNSHIFIFIIIFVGSLKNAHFYKQQ